MKLYAKNLYFLGENEESKLYDCCVHGDVLFKIGDDILHEGSDWCVSASAYRFLKTLFDDHKAGNEEFLIPCCGHSIYPSEDKKSVTIVGCNNGVDFDVIHESENVIIKTAEKEYNVPFKDYKNAVMDFAKQIYDFYKSNPPRKFDNVLQKDGFQAFMYEWNLLFGKAQGEEI